MADDTHAILMGDLVSSEALPADAHATFNAAIAAANDAAAQDLASPLTITLGDEFQGIVRSLTAAANLARDIRFALLRHGIDCRFVVALAAITTPINAERAWNMMGPGLGRARAMLNRKRDVSLYHFSLPGDERAERSLTAFGAGLTTIERGWTARQRDDVIASIAGATADEIARERNVAAHSVYKVRSAANLESYLLLWAAVLEVLGHLDRETAS